MRSSLLSPHLSGVKAKFAVHEHVVLFTFTRNSTECKEKKFLTKLVLGHTLDRGLSQCGVGPGNQTLLRTTNQRKFFLFSDWGWVYLGLSKKSTI